ncbi:AraC family transcriptional regulator [Rubrolithibacter danxiaensis]|uniref:AraC family transcriptional regulator n=1 Tax=Rubrolithibacter danxiaensis TaxID=3390805 RepID=UPI003BF81D80
MKQDIPVYDLCSLKNIHHEDLLISRFASYLENHSKLILPHRHSFFHVVYFTSGKGNHTIDFKQFPVKPFQIYFMIPGQVHSWNFEGQVDGYIINFSATFFQSFLLKPGYLQKFPFFSGIADECVLDVQPFLQERTRQLFEDLIVETSVSKKTDLDKLRILILHIFILVDEIASKPKQSPAASYNYTILKNFQKLIDLNFNNLRLPKNYAELLFITPNHLNGLCNEILGVSAGELIRNRIALEAKRLLINADLSISQIAFKLNFKDNSYFTKFFRKQTGITPEEFRKKELNIKN